MVDVCVCSNAFEGIHLGFETLAVHAGATLQKSSLTWSKMMVHVNVDSQICDCNLQSVPKERSPSL